MNPALDHRRPSLDPRDSVGVLTRRIGDLTLAAAWRLLHAGDRGPYVVAFEDRLDRRYYTADDGWSAPILRLSPGASGPPVLLAHGLGGSWRDWILAPETGLARRLVAAGHDVWLLAHRGDRDAVAPPDPRPFSVDDIATRDLPAALDLVRALTGYDQVVLLGHGFGAQLACAHLALGDIGAVSALVALGGAVELRPAASELRTAALVATLLPSGWVLPSRRLAQVSTPLVRSGDDLASPDTLGAVARARMRHGGDLYGGVVRQVARWIAAGRLTDATGNVELLPCLPQIPAFVAAADADPACPPDAAAPLARQLGCPLHVIAGGHLDPIAGRTTPEAIERVLLPFLASVG